MVKISKLELAVLLLTAAFLAFCAGWLLRGSGGSEPLRIESERTLAQPDEVVVLPAPTPEPTLSVDRPININTADSETLQLLPGIGESVHFFLFLFFLRFLLAARTSSMMIRATSRTARRYATGGTD